MNKMLQRWDYWWLRLGPPQTMAFVRICLGLFYLVYFGVTGLQLRHTISDQGVVLPLLTDINVPWLDVLLSPPPYAVAIILFCTLVIALLSFTAGMLYKTSTLLILILGLYFWQLSWHHFHATFHRLTLFILVVMLFAKADTTYSLINKIKHGTWQSTKKISILPQRLLAIQITIMYLGAGWQKLWLPAWQEPEILSASLAFAGATPLAYFILNLSLPTWVYAISLKVLILFELVLPFGLWHKKTKYIWILAAIAFHISIALLFSIRSFLALIPLYIVFFTPESVEHFIADHKQKNELK